MLFFRKTCLLLGLILSLSGCIGGANVTIPRDHYYRLPATSSVKPLPAPLLAGTLEISAVQTTGMLHERAILFVREQQPLEVNPYHYYYWVNTPASLLQQHLLDYLRLKNFAREQHRYRSDNPADFRLEAELLQFERYIRKHGAEARVTLELVLRDNHSKRILLRRRYQQNIEANSPDMADTANAFGKALAIIYKQFAGDVAALKM
ncbi:hypothetical protein MNBD_GAMMA24-138 [hydrothermal vent metagenome]|uniref:ABC-type transport auxiliary lipoprotein component domain-containing protein n=1 Tax=hydrothermal vent metagenome TaxID=652676 RepID=A0A3B1BR77_9ZZZZ